MKLRSSLMDGLTWEATLSTAPAGLASGQPIIVLNNEEILSPEDAQFGDFTIMEATDGEREALRQAGYSLPDWSPNPEPEPAPPIQPEPPK
jgi:hypothetical protein